MQMDIALGYDVADYNSGILLAWDGKRAAARAMADVVQLA